MLLLCACLSVVFAASVRGQTPAATALEPNTPIERELKGGQTDTYSLRVIAGNFLHVVVEQKGVDVEVNLRAPDGRSVFDIDGPSGRFGPEEVAAIADATGEYRLNVISPNKSAAAGLYQVFLDVPRVPTENDRKRVAAEAAFVEAMMKLAPQRTAAARKAAIEKCREALTFFQTVGDQYREAWIMHQILLLYAQTGEFRKARDFGIPIPKLFEAVKDDVGRSSALNILGGMSDILGDPQGALRYYGESLALARSSKDQYLEANILNNIGKIYNDLADWQRSIDYYDQALTLFQQIGNQRLQGIALHNIGVAQIGLGLTDRALDTLQRSLALRRASGDKSGEADTLTSIGYIYNSRGMPEKALEFFNQALPLRQTAGDRRGEGVTLDHIGIAYASLGQLNKALEFHLQALDRHRAAQSPRTEAVALGNIGHVYNLLGDFQKAIDHSGQALTIFRRIGDRQNEAKMLQDIAFAEQKSGKLTDALAHLDTALGLIEAVRSTAGAQQSRSSYFASEHGAYELYIDLLMQLHRQDPTAGYDAKAIQASERMRARSLMEMLTEAQVDIRQGTDPALLDREQQLGQTLNAKAQRQIQLRASNGSQDEIAALDREINTLEVEYQQVQTSIRKQSPAYAALTQPQPLTLQQIQKELDANTLLLEYSLGNEHSYLWTVSRTGLNSYELPGRQQIQQNARKVYELLTARGTERQGETDSQRKARLAAADAELASSAAALSAEVLKPAASELGTKRLFIVADDALQYVPFAVLPVAGGKGTRTVSQSRALMLDHDIVDLPSVSSLAVQRQGLAGRKPAPNEIAVIADPVFSADDERLKPAAPMDKTTFSPAASASRQLEYVSETGKAVIRRLPFTRQEADEILAVAPSASNLRAIDFQADRAAVTSGELSKFRYVHFATHGYLDSERPDLSAIVLSLVDKNGKPQDGFLRAHDIYNLKLSADLVVLSACQTGLGKDIKGEGLVGLTRGFMYAGARRVVVSLWNVNDKATAELMQRFYRGMLRENLPPAAALRKAQAELSRDTQWHSPYYWAAFVLQGD